MKIVSIALLVLAAQAASALELTDAERLVIEVDARIVGPLKRGQSTARALSGRTSADVSSPGMETSRFLSAKTLSVKRTSSTGRTLGSTIATLTFPRLGGAEVTTADGG